MFTAAGKSAAVSAANYIEDVFSTWLYTGNSSTQTITNGIDLAGKGGLVWTKRRNDLGNHGWVDTVRTRSSVIFSDSTVGAGTSPAGQDITAFNSNGYSVGGNFNFSCNISGGTYVSWTFRKQAKFFDVVTYTGTGVARTVSHNLGSVPGCIIVKRLDGASRWSVYHRSFISALYSAALNANNGQVADSTIWNSTAPTSTQFSVGDAGSVNASGGTYVAYLFAHNAGGFGAAGTDNVISCGSYAGTSTNPGPTITLGYEPQWILIKNADSAQNWSIFDNMRGLPVGSGDAVLRPNQSDAEVSGNFVSINATGFQLTTTDSTYNTGGETFVYIAIRRGPMKTPTSGTSVFSPVAYTGTSAARVLPAGFPVDLTVIKNRTDVGSAAFFDRLRGNGALLESATTGAEVTNSNFPGVIGIQDGTTFPAASFNGNTFNWIDWALRRAPSFFDVVCYTGTGALLNVTHNLGVSPELIITKIRNGANDWATWCGAAVSGNSNTLFLNTTQQRFAGINYWGSSYSFTMTSTTFSLGSSTAANQSGSTYVAYLFASCPGVSKVGSYTGTGALQTINCGFASGARFVLIKRVDSSGDWWAYDSARGITSGNDPYLFFNSTAVEVTNTNYVDTASTGFQVTAAAPAGLNANGGTYIFLAIA